MKTLYLTYSPSPYRVDFFEELSNYVDLTVCYETTPEEDMKKNKRDASWYTTYNSKFCSIYLKQHRLFSQKYSTQLINLIKNNQYDIIVIGGYSSLTAMLTMIYLKIKKIPFILNTDGGFPKKNESIIKRKIKHFFISMANFYLSTGENAQKYLTYYGAKENNIYKYPFTSMRKNELSKEIISSSKKSEIRKLLKIADKFTFITIGRFIERKGFDVLIKASKGLENSQVLIVGDKPGEEYIDLVKKLELDNIIFVDYKPKNEIIKYLQASDVFVLPTREDIWGLVINEALSIGLPVITTDQCGAGLDLIENYYNGFIIKTNDVKELHNRMNYLIKHEKSIPTYSKNALESIKDYTIENEAETHYKIFNEIIKKMQG